jgi:hypothetical protein
VAGAQQVVELLCQLRRQVEQQPVVFLALLAVLDEIVAVHPEGAAQ